MSTTNLFVELLVIGSGAVFWITLLLLSLTGYTWIPILDLKSTLALPALITVLALVYVIGIVIDRIADRLSEQYTKRIVRKYYVNSYASLYDDRRLVLSNQTPSTKLFLYSRSRARICRGWTLNAFLILVFSNIFLFVQMRSHSLYWQLTIYSTLVVAILLCACCFSWIALKNSEYIKTKEQAEFLRKEHANP